MRSFSGTWMKLETPPKDANVGRKSTYKAAVDFDEGEMTVDLIGVPDTSEDAEARRERVEKLIAKLILLGQTRGRPRKETSDEEQKAA